MQMQASGPLCSGSIVAAEATNNFVADAWLLDNSGVGHKGTNRRSVNRSVGQPNENNKNLHSCRYQFLYETVLTQNELAPMLKVGARPVPIDYELQLHVYDVTDVKSPHELDLDLAIANYPGLNWFSQLVAGYQPVVRAYAQAAHFAASMSEETEDTVTTIDLSAVDPIDDFSDELEQGFNGIDFREWPSNHLNSNYLFSELYPELEQFRQ